MRSNVPARCGRISRLSSRRRPVRGKTGLLIQRYLKLLSLAGAPEEIIAITFTRKAAAEMQGRILTALERAGQAAVPNDEHDKKILELARAALNRAEQQGWQIMQNPARLRIQTIDSLSAALTRQMPLLARLGTQPETVEDAADLYQQAAINTLAGLESNAAWSDAIARLIAHLDNDLPRVRTAAGRDVGQTRSMARLCGRGPRTGARWNAPWRP